MEPKYPDVEVQLSGGDGNVFAIIGRMTKALRREVDLAAPLSLGGLAGAVRLRAARGRLASRLHLAPLPNHHG